MKAEVRMETKLSVAALAVSGATLLLVLLSPLPAPPEGEAAASGERMLLLAQLERRAAAEDSAGLRRLEARFEELVSGVAGPEEVKLRLAGRARKLVGEEFKGRRSEYKGKLAEIAKFRKKEVDELASKFQVPKETAEEVLKLVGEEKLARKEALRRAGGRAEKAKDELEELGKKTDSEIKKLLKGRQWSRYLEWRKQTSK